MRRGRYVHGAKDWRRLGIAAGTVCACGLVASGSAFGQAGRVGHGKSGGKAHTPAHLTTVSMVQDEIGLGNTVIYVAEHKGFFKRNGLKISLQTLGTGSTTADVMLSGKVDVAVSASYEMGTVAVKGAPLEAFGEYGNTPVDVCVSNSFAQSKGLSSLSSLGQLFSSLKGAKIGISGPNSAPDLEGRYLMAKYGHFNPESQAQEISVGSHAALTEAVESSQVDAVFSSPPTCNEITAAGKGKELARGSDFPSFMKTPEYILYAQKSYLKSHGKVARELDTALKEAEQYAHKNVAGTARVMQALFPTISVSAMQSIYTREMEPAIPLTPAMTRAGWNTVSQVIRPATGASLNTKPGVIWTNAYTK